MPKDTTRDPEPLEMPAFDNVPGEEHATERGGFIVSRRATLQADLTEGASVAAATDTDGIALSPEEVLMARQEADEDDLDS